MRVSTKGQIRHGRHGSPGLPLGLVVPFEVPEAVGEERVGDGFVLVGRQMPPELALGQLVS